MSQATNENSPSAIPLHPKRLPMRAAQCSKAYRDRKKERDGRKAKPVTPAMPGRVKEGAGARRPRSSILKCDQRRLPIAAGLSLPHNRCSLLLAPD
jgi:hypothetical protein